MNLIEKEAKTFYERGFLRGIGSNTLSNIKDLITTKLYDFSRNRDQLDFLKTLRTLSIEDKENHKKTCRNENCDYEETRDVAVFAIDQEIDSIMKYYSYESPSLDAFTSKEESNIHAKLNDIIHKLEKQGFGQQIIFDEIEELKYHFNLGKKNWFQILKGKLFDLAAAQVLEKAVISEIFAELKEDFDTVQALQ